MSVRLVFFGTGSGKPVPSRNVSGVGLFREGELYMFDCGEGTQVQIARSPMRPGALSGIFLTHFHGDHVNGLPGLLGTLTLNSRDDTLPLVGPVGLRAWLKTLREVGILNTGFKLAIQEIESSGVVFQGEGFRIETAPLNHRIDCWGYSYIEDERPGRFDVETAKALGVPAGPLFGRLQRGETISLEDGTQIRPDQVLGQSRPGLKIAFVWDTSPCEEAPRFAQGADVLVHESTYLAGDERTAHKRKHSTAGDAARCAKEAGVRQLVLTHFSQKHNRLQEFVDGAREIFPNTIAAHDFMELEVHRVDQRSE